MDGWQIETDADDTAAYAALAQDRPWAGYAIADLDPPFREHTRVALARHGSAPPAAACLVLRHPAFTVTVTHGDPSGLAAILATIELPAHTFVSVRAEHRPVLERHFAFPTGLREMRRMSVTAATFARPRSPLPAVARLGQADLPALLDLYAEYPESAFLPDQLRHGIFYGVRAAGGLAAAGGTHVVSARYGVAAVGNIYTRPAARGHGCATAITAAVVGDLLAVPCHDIILNVAVPNVTAAAIYTRLGFRVHCPFWEGQAERRVA